MAFKMRGFSAFTKDTKFEGSKHDVGQNTSVNTGPSNKDINALKNKFKQLKKLGAENEIVKDPTFKKYNMYISPDGNEIEVDNKTI
jgi:hypothetical protein